jgi:hypothetical protein
VCVEVEFFFSLLDQASLSLSSSLKKKNKEKEKRTDLADDLVDVVGDERGALAVLGVDVVVHQLDAVVRGKFLRERARGAGVRVDEVEKNARASPRLFALWKALEERASPVVVVAVVGSASLSFFSFTYVSLKDLSVFLCRLDTAMRAASCVEIMVCE